MYNFLIDANKWVKVGELQLDNQRPYWFKKSNGQIVMGAPFSNGYSSGIADCFIDDYGDFKIKADTFHLVRGGEVQPVIQL